MTRLALVVCVVATAGCSSSWFGGRASFQIPGDHGRHVRPTTSATDFTPVVYVGAGRLAPRPSPDGTSVLVIQTGTGSARTRLVTFTTGGPTPRAPSTLLPLHWTFRDVDWWPDGHTLIVVRDVGDDDWRLSRLTLDGHNHETPLADPLAVPTPHRPRVSRDGRRVVVGTLIAGKRTVVVIDVASGAATVLGEGFDPELSPDGTRVAFTRIVDKVDCVLTARATDGGDVVTVSDPMFASGQPTYAPDGSRIAFVARRRAGTRAPVDNDVANLFTVRPDGTGLAQLTDGDGAVTSPAWSRSGVIYYEAEDSDTPGYHVGSLRPVAAPPPAPPSGVRIRLTVTRVEGGLALPVGTSAVITVYAIYDQQAVRFGRPNGCNTHIVLGGLALRPFNSFGCEGLADTPPFVTGGEVTPTSRDGSDVLHLRTGANTFELSDDADGPFGAYTVTGRADMLPDASR